MIKINGAGKQIITFLRTRSITKSLMKYACDRCQELFDDEDVVDTGKVFYCLKCWNEQHIDFLKKFQKKKKP